MNTPFLINLISDSATPFDQGNAAGNLIWKRALLPRLRHEFLSLLLRHARSIMADMNTTEIVAEIDAEIERLQRAKALLIGTRTNSIERRSSGGSGVGNGKRTMSELAGRESRQRRRRGGPGRNVVSR
jgi:hypothetical protein